MNVLILGSGGREHAFAWKIAQSVDCEKLYTAPGNPGTAAIGENLAISPEDFDSVRDAVLKYNIDLVVVGPEAPLVKGIVDYFKASPVLKDVRIIGPGKAGAQLEGSKDFAKAFMAKNEIPTAAYRTFTKDTLSEAKAYLKTIPSPYVLKADGLAGGKGVVILTDLEEALEEIVAMLGENKFGAASERVVIENFLNGIEMSVFALTDGKDFVLLPSAKDYKRIGEGDTGLNTGGMGAISPVPFADKAFMDKVINRIVKPTVTGLQSASIDFVGFIFFGLIKVGDDPFVIEYNVRMGDPETEVVLPRVESDLLKMLVASTDGTLGKVSIDYSKKEAATVMLVAGGYPEKYEKGKSISFPETPEDVIVFQAGTAHEEGKLQTSGGRVISVTGLGNTLSEALTKAYETANQIEFEGKYLRRDIGKDVQ